MANCAAHANEEDGSVVEMGADTNLQWAFSIVTKFWLHKHRIR